MFRTFLKPSLQARLPSKPLTPALSLKNTTHVHQRAPIRIHALSNHTAIKFHLYQKSDWGIFHLQLIYKPLWQNEWDLFQELNEDWCPMCKFMLYQVNVHIDQRFGILRGGRRKGWLWRVIYPQEKQILIYLPVRQTPLTIYLYCGYSNYVIPLAKSFSVI